MMIFNALHFVMTCYDIQFLIPICMNGHYLFLFPISVLSSYFSTVARLKMMFLLALLAEQFIFTNANPQCHGYYSVLIKSEEDKSFR